MVFITCNVTENLLGKDAFQEVVSPALQPIYQGHLSGAGSPDPSDIMREAFAVAATGRPAPVLIDFLKNVTAPNELIDYEPMERKEHIKHGRLQALTHRIGWGHPHAGAQP